MNNLFWGELFQIVYLIALGLAPSMAWLWYFLRQDNHPEPKKMILQVFLAGFLGTVVAFALEWMFIAVVVNSKAACLSCTYILPQLIDIGKASSLPFLAMFGILAALAFIEEWTKYEAARTRIMYSSYFDEPVDAMIYLIVAALGFAAAENIAYVFQNAAWAVEIVYFRFLSATFLHVLASAILGYFFALSLIWHKRRAFYLIIGFVLAVSLHAVFNFLIMVSDRESNALFFLALIMLGSFFFVSTFFRRVKRLTFQHITASPYNGERTVS